MAGNTNKAVFREWTCRPSLVTGFGKPLMGWFMMDMHRIRQGKK